MPPIVDWVVFLSKKNRLCWDVGPALSSKVTLFSLPEVFRGLLQSSSLEGDNKKRSSTFFTTGNSLKVSLRAGYLSVRTAGGASDRHWLKARLTNWLIYLLTYLLTCIMSWTRTRLGDRLFPVVGARVSNRPSVSLRLENTYTRLGVCMLNAHLFSCCNDCVFCTYIFTYLLTQMQVVAIFIAKQAENLHL